MPKKCPVCNGTGENPGFPLLITTEQPVCPRCNGKGYLPENQKDKDSKDKNKPSKK